MGGACKIFLCLFIAIICMNFAKTARILGFFPTTSMSHLIIQMEVIKTLVERGHDVTVVTTMPLSEKSPKYRHVKLPDVSLPKDFFSKFIDGGDNIIASFKLAKFAITAQLDAAENALINFKKTRVWEEESFDLLVFGIFLNEFLLGVAAHYKCPIVGIDTHKPTMTANSLVGNPHEIFYVPSAISPDHQPLTFFGRVRNFILFVMEAVISEVYMNDVRDRYVKSFPADEYPAFDEILKNVSLVLHTSHFSEGFIRPEVPAFIQIGGIQSKPKPDPLPKDIAEVLGNATKHGAILFSFGTNALSSDRDPQTMKKIFKVLSSLKETVLWKWENDEYPGIAPNIVYKKWLPQDDILAHPNTKLFISHCGLGSIVEAKFHGVPVLAVPLFGDQFGIANSVVAAGYGVSVDFMHLTEESFRQALKEVLENSTYRDNIQNFAKLFRDRPISIRDTAAFWMEYVIRHRGAKHLQSPAIHMNTVEYYGLDIAACLFVFIYIVYKIAKLCICKMWSLFRRKSPSRQQKGKRD